MERRLLALLACVVAVPIGLAGAFLAAVAGLAEVASGWFGLFDVDSWFEDISWFDWLTGGPGATPGSGIRYVTFMIGGVVAMVCGTAVVYLWDWSKPNSGER